MRTANTEIKAQLKQIVTALGNVEKELRRLMQLRAGLNGAGPQLEERPKRQLTLSPKRRAQLKLQGSYLGYMRQLKPKQKAQVKVVKEKRGMEAAIRIATKLAGSA